MELIEVGGKIYRKCNVRYNAIRVDALILEDDYIAARELKRSKKRSKTDREKLEEKLDNAWAKAVKARDKICQKCGSNKNKLEAHHIFTRSFKSTCWDIDNGISLCTYCHKFGPESAHKSPESFRDWLIPIIGQHKYDKLKWKANSTRYKMSLGEMEMWLTKLRSMV
jgi:hypothetical protein